MSAYGFFFFAETEGEEGITYATIDPTVSNLQSGRSQIGVVSGRHMLRSLSHQTADVEVDVISTIVCLQDSCSCSTQSAMAGSAGKGVESVVASSWFKMEESD
jgi:hypothetical protein